MDKHVVGDTRIKLVKLSAKLFTVHFNDHKVFLYLSQNKLVSNISVSKLITIVFFFPYCMLCSNDFALDRTICKSLHAASMNNPQIGLKWINHKLNYFRL